ncbi:SDR family NAD(P)-dependent oxidoreductase [Spirosoma sp. HMF4905]|uniref:SDR family NAD(P)-dependent oxidoreductase n=1 Tax=Spirosoma arboris TaxID=2682092 RepID=A0A7K1SR46_9BACT|nr:SDR family oxidoreductase [Spirosoma arboris]MVM36257.1 SDR family NAD(P)-dependent oxidoreductase [Spirosoma arboris]
MNSTIEIQNNEKTVLITGASSGIGRELSRLFAKDGYSLVLVGRDQDSLQQLASNFNNQYGTQTTIIHKDLADPKAPEEIYGETSGRGQQIDILVNDAGFGEYGKFATETDLQKELSVVQVNAVALMHLSKLYLKDMVARDSGKILMLGSEVSVIPNPMMAVYGATKAFIKSFAEAIRNELQGTNVTITVLMPGATNTNFFKVAGAENTQGADPQKTANPADVAKEGYQALMSGKDHVVAGWMNKVRVAASHILPDPLLAANVRKDMTPKDEAEPQKQTTVIALAIGIGILGSLWLVARNQRSYGPSAYNKMKYRHKANKAFDSVADPVKGSYKWAKNKLEDTLV